MKITLINHSDTLGGASVVTFRLMEALCRAGVDARLLVGRKNGDSLRVAEAAGSRRRMIPFLAEHASIFSHNGFSRSRLFRISIANAGLPLDRHPWVIDADVVILNWINQGLLSLDTIKRMARMKPVIWTMHDMWNLTGGCHHAGSCTRYLTHCADCPLLGFMAGPKDLSSRHFDAKQRLYDSAPLTFVAVSSWLRDRAAESALLCCRDVRLIHNPFPIDALCAEPAFSPSELGLPADRPVIMLSAARLDDPVKDLPLAVAGLNELHLSGTDAVALMIGAIKNPDALAGLKIPLIAPGPIYDKSRLQAFAAHSSVVLSTSTFESFGATLLEGQAAGAVPVGFTHDGRADIITDGISGYAITDRTPDAVAQALRRALTDPLPRADLIRAAARYSSDTVANRYIALCEQLLGRR
ncbi:MAG: glycosyltransferase [Muribaculaceae bacterium]|nr:glycosyltransferase [Muribaculaceae bacterium]